MEGFKIISIKDGIITSSHYVDGRVDYQPETLYKVDKINAFNPTKRIRRKPYHKDTTECTVILKSSEYLELLDMLRDGEKKYVEFTQDETVIQLPITVVKEPKLSDDHRFDTDEVKFTLESLYIEHSFINFDYVYGYGITWGNNYGF
jgi:hypothetical protein